LNKVKNAYCISCFIKKEPAEEFRWGAAKRRITPLPV
jgi:hypothetical protein